MITAFIVCVYKEEKRNIFFSNYNQVINCKIQIVAKVAYFYEIYNQDMKHLYLLIQIY